VHPPTVERVLVRWSVSILLFETLYTQVSTLKRIAREFKQHSFEELEVDMTTYAADLQIFLPHLVEQGYREGSDWQIVDSEGVAKIVFKTLPDTREIFIKYC
jgi:hypothetical protein